MEQQKEIVKKVLNYIEDHIEKEFNVDKLAFKQLYVYPPKIYRNIGAFEPKQNRISLCENFCNIKSARYSMLKAVAA